MLIAVVGKSGSGKSFISQMLANRNPNSIWVDIDRIGHESLTDYHIKEELIKYFGKRIMVDDTIDRETLSNLVFNDKDKLKILNELTEEYIKVKIQQVIVDNRDKIIILDWALLGETEFLDLCDIKILVKANQNIRAQRIINRDKVNIEKFNARERASYNYDEIKFDLILDNSQNFDLEKAVNKIYEKSYISGEF
ncbi:MAG: dephospho-CoA kinase [Bacilli bacterium]